MVPEHPVAVVMGWPCSSWPRMYRTTTREQSIGSSSRTLTSNATVCPNSNGCPSTGEANVTTGAIGPTTNGSSAEAERPVLSVTFSVGRYEPFSGYVYVGFGAVESTVPFASKSHAYRRGSPSGSVVPALENVTVSGASPASGVALTFGIGVRLPRTKSIRASWASGFSEKKPSPYSRT
ncbi:hypothetical protein Phou_068700 [Phytohabitans houttuyneae]|uniref:Uncharacterized protein n=1 Tax=Phytohabitans houttuyneae TaxID=1076126 RepID=A0A6V8KH34_9ACTN|nr:hypothetical protein Phou_068700 [Phytohabitans houttuyneae]